jgi:hypothetical protein
LSVFADVDFVDFVGKADRSVSVNAVKSGTRRVCGSREPFVSDELVNMHSPSYDKDSLVTENKSFYH